MIGGILLDTILCLVELLNPSFDWLNALPHPLIGGRAGNGVSPPRQPPERPQRAGEPEVPSAPSGPPVAAARRM